MLEGMKAGLLTEETRVKISIVTLAALIIFMVTSTAAAVTWKANIENEAANTKALATENSAAVHIMAPLVTEMGADIRWIREDMERRNDE